MICLKKLIGVVLIGASCYGGHEGQANKPAANSFAAYPSAKINPASSKPKAACCKGAPSRIKAL